MSGSRAFLLLCLFACLPVLAVSPVIEQIAAELGTSAAIAGMLTGAPILCCALATPAAAALIGRIGVERAGGAALLALAAGVVLRSARPVTVLLTGAVVTGCGLSVVNLTIPLLIARDRPARAASFDLRLPRLTVSAVSKARI